MKVMKVTKLKEKYEQYDISTTTENFYIKAGNEWILIHNSPAIFAGIDPADGKFFVAKKGLFNVDPQMFKSVAEIQSSTLASALKSKFTTAYEEFSKLGIKSGVYQGDLMFTKEDLKTEEIEGNSYLTFQPNTIIYAVPVQSSLAKKIRKAQIGIVWHTTYTGTTIQNMSASFGKSIVDKMKNISTVWMDDATYKDVSGSITFTNEETAIFNSYLSLIGKLFNKIPATALNYFAKNDEFLIRLKAFNNSKVRAGKNITTVNPKDHINEFISHVKNYYSVEADKKKTKSGKESSYSKLLPILEYMITHKNDLTKIMQIVILITKAKSMVVDKLNSAASLNTFLKTRNGFRVTEQEGYVAIDRMGSAVKLVDRLEFSMANFSPDVIKGWEK